MKQKNINLNIDNGTVGRIKGMAYLILSIMIVIFFVFVLAPVIDEVPNVKPLINFIDEHEINAAALYYTDIEEFSVAELNMKNTLDYCHRFTSDGKALKITSSSQKK